MTVCSECRDLEICIGCEVGLCYVCCPKDNCPFNASKRDGTEDEEKKGKEKPE